ncbi:MAG: methyl-accepting chemotaxis protein [Rhodospirillales bacterium]
MALLKMWGPSQRRATSPADIEPALASPPPRSVQAAPRRDLLDASEMVEAELESAAALCRRQSARGMVQLRSAAASAGLILTEADEVARAARAASGNVTAVAAASEQISAAGREIAGQAACSLAASRQSVSETRAASDSIGALTAAATAIDDVVRAIAAIASRTNLLALNATIEAARAGEAGRGFAIVAAEVKELSRQTAASTRDITARIGGMQVATRASAAAIARATEAASGIETASGAVATAVEAQEATIRDVTGRLQETARETARVADLMGDVAGHSASVLAATDAAQADAARTDATIEALRGDLTVQLRRAASGDAASVPLAMAATLRGGSAGVAVTMLQLSETGALVRLAEDQSLPNGAALALEVVSIGALPATLMAASRGRAALALQPQADQAASLRAMLVALRDDADRFGACARTHAAQVQAALETAVQEGGLTRSALFDSDYRSTEDSDPPQFVTGFSDAADRLVRPILDMALAFDARVVGAFIVDRNGYAPTHNTKVSQMQRANDPVWNARNCRNRWIFDDRAGLAAGRTTRETLLQCYERDMGGGERMTISEADVPIIIAGEHWGGFRLMYRPG